MAKVSSLSFMLILATASLARRCCAAWRALRASSSSSSVAGLAAASLSSAASSLWLGSRLTAAGALPFLPRPEAGAVGALAAAAALAAAVEAMAEGRLRSRLSSCGTEALQTPPLALGSVAMVSSWRMLGG